MQLFIFQCQFLSYISKLFILSIEFNSIQKVQNKIILKSTFLEHMIFTKKKHFSLNNPFSQFDDKLKLGLTGDFGGGSNQYWKTINF